MVIEKYKQLVIDHFKPFYTAVDDGHGLEHVTGVTNLALEINKKLNLNISEYDIVVAGIAHDIYSYTCRDDHHTKAKEYILQDVGEIYDYIINKTLIACAVGEHRASYDGVYSSKLSELISSADRGEPNLKDIIQRIHLCAIDPSLIFAIEKTGIPDIILPDGKTLKEMHAYLIAAGYRTPFIKTYIHLCEKYSLWGYARYPDIYKQMFSTKLCYMYLEIDKISMFPHLIYGYIGMGNNTKNGEKNES